MKLTIDFAVKTIKIEGSASLGELMDQLDKLFPHYEWRSYKLIQDVQYVQQSQTWITPPAYGTITIPDLTVPYNPYPGTAPYGPIADWNIVTCENKDVMTVNALNGLSISSCFADNDIITLTYAETPGEVLEVAKRYHD